MSFLLLLEAQLGDDMTIDVILPNGLPVLCDVTLPSEQIVSEVCFACSCIDILLSVMYNIWLRPIKEGVERRKRSGRRIETIDIAMS